MQVHLIPPLSHIYLYIFWTSGSIESNCIKQAVTLCIPYVAHAKHLLIAHWGYVGSKNIATEMFPSLCWVIHLQFLRLAATKQPSEHLLCVNWAHWVRNLLRDNCHSPRDVPLYTFTSGGPTIPQHFTNKPTWSCTSKWLLWCSRVFHGSENQGSCHLYSSPLNQSHKTVFALNSACFPLASGKK